MIVGFQPGGTIRAAYVVLKPDETVPSRYNVPEAIIYREDAETHEWIMVKPKFSILPVDSPLLSQPALPEVELFPLTSDQNSDSLFEHQDIINLDEVKE
jgi:hypothetical protein